MVWGVFLAEEDIGGFFILVHAVLVLVATITPVPKYRANKYTPKGIFQLGKRLARTGKTVKAEDTKRITKIEEMRAPMWPL